MNIAQLLVRSARVYPNAPALYHGKRLVADYAGLAERAARFAGHLRVSCGLRPGDRVGVFMKNCPEYLEVLYGIWYAGLVAVPINAKLHAREALFALLDSGAAALFVTEDLAGDLVPLLADARELRAVLRPGQAHYAELLAAEPVTAPVERAPDDLAWLFYTSGTTGKPKGVMLTHRNLLAMTMCYFADVDPVARQDAVVYSAPISHGAGMYNFAHVLAAARHVVPGTRAASMRPSSSRLPPTTATCRCSPPRPWSSGSSITSRRQAPTCRASRRSSTAAGRCTWRTSAKPST